MHFPAILTGKACIFVPDCKPCVQERGGEKRPEKTPCRAAEHPEGERADKYVKLTGTDEHFI